MATLFPERMRDGAQLALGLGGDTRHITRCPHCEGLMEGRSCRACATFVCTRCQLWTSGNGGNGQHCYVCLQAPSLAPQL